MIVAVGLVLLAAGLSEWRALIGLPLVYLGWRGCAPNMNLADGFLTLLMTTITAGIALMCGSAELGLAALAGVVTWVTVSGEAAWRCRPIPELHSSRDFSQHDCRIVHQGSSRITMKLGQATGTVTSTVYNVPRAEVRILWVNDFYDVPLQGMAEVAGCRYLFEIIDRDLLGTSDELHRYWLITLSPEQLREEEGWHELFCCKVGTHFDYTGRATLPVDQTRLDEFYVPYRMRVQPDYAGNEVIGWFTL